MIQQFFLDYKVRLFVYLLFFFCIYISLSHTQTHTHAHTIKGGPHNNTIAAVSVCLHEATQSSFVEYQRAVVANARALATALLERQYVVLTGGTDTHLLLLDLVQSRGIDGARVDLTLERALIACNRNAIVGDQRPLLPSGIRLGIYICIL